MKAAFKLVVFDIAGTTIQDNDGVAGIFMYAMEQHGYPVDLEQASRIMGYKKNIAIEILLQDNYPGALAKNRSIIAAIHTTFNNEMVEYYKREKIEAMPGAEKTFIWLKENNIKVALNTGFSKIVTDTLLKKVDWYGVGFIDYTISSDEVGSGRPAPDMIQQIMKATGVDDAKAVVKVGDTEVDIAEGRAAGCGLVVSVTTGSFTREQLFTYQPDIIIDDLNELPSLIKPVTLA